tara:strand:- start:34938 stop:35321 length:384 start_codon:yes stop_codon:yes gene_type:complete
MARAKMGSSAGWNYNYVESATASFSLEVGDSGKVFILKDASVTVTLPSLSDISAGFCVKLISGDASEHVVDGGASKVYGTIVDAGTTPERINAASGYTLAAGAIGDFIELISDGTNWYISGMTDAGA